MCAFCEKATGKHSGDVGQRCDLRLSPEVPALCGKRLEELAVGKGKDRRGGKRVYSVKRGIAVIEGRGRHDGGSVTRQWGTHNDIFGAGDEVGEVGGDLVDLPSASAVTLTEDVVKQHRDNGGLVELPRGGWNRNDGNKVTNPGRELLRECVDRVRSAVAVHGAKVEIRNWERSRQQRALRFGRGSRR
jgi:hypothetical protein